MKYYCVEIPVKSESLYDYDRKNFLELANALTFAVKVATENRIFVRPKVEEHLFKSKDANNKIRFIMDNFRIEQADKKVTSFADVYFEIFKTVRELTQKEVKEVGKPYCPEIWDEKEVVVVKKTRLYSFTNSYGRVKYSLEEGKDSVWYEPQTPVVAQRDFYIQEDSLEVEDDPVKRVRVELHLPERE